MASSLLSQPCMIAGRSIGPVHDRHANTFRYLFRPRWCSHGWMSVSVFMHRSPCDQDWMQTEFDFLNSGEDPVYPPTPSEYATRSSCQSFEPLRSPASTIRLPSIQRSLFLLRYLPRRIGLTPCPSGAMPPQGDEGVTSSGLIKLAGADWRRRSSAFPPPCKHTLQHVSSRIVMADPLHRVARIGATKPDNCATNPIGPLLERTQRGGSVWQTALW
jgi:hypothetical protein